MQCPICAKPYKGKVGVGVHLVKSHTTDERGALYVKQLLAPLPLLLATLLIVEICQRLEAGR